MHPQILFSALGPIYPVTQKVCVCCVFVFFYLFFLQGHADGAQNEIGKDVITNMPSFLLLKNRLKQTCF